MRVILLCVVSNVKLGDGCAAFVDLDFQYRDAPVLPVDFSSQLLYMERLLVIRRRSPSNLNSEGFYATLQPVMVRLLLPHRTLKLGNAIMILLKCSRQIGDTGVLGDQDFFELLSAWC